MSVLQDNIAEHALGSVTVVDQSFTVGANVQRYLLALLTCNADPTPSSITYGGVAMGAVATGLVKVKVYGLVAPATGANTFNCQWAAARDAHVVLLSLYNVDQVAPTGTIITVDDGGGTTWTTTPTVKPYGRAYEIGIVASDAVATGAQTVLYDHVQFAGWHVMSWVPSTQAITWTMVAGGEHKVYTIPINPIKPPAGAVWFW